MKCLPFEDGVNPKLEKKFASLVGLNEVRS